VRGHAARSGLKAEIGGRTLQDIARDMIAIAAEGLKARGVLNGAGQDERVYLAELEEIADSGVTPAERLLELYHGEWRGDAGRAYEHCAY
jgi:glutamate--cysteine ligase